MGIKTVIFDCIMVASYLVSIYFILLQFGKIAKGLKTLEKDCQGLNEEETMKLHHKRYSHKFFNFLYIAVGFLVVGIIATLLDGISGFNEETMKFAMPTALVAFIYLNVAFIVYETGIRRKYDLKLNRNDYTVVLGYTGGGRVAIRVTAAFAFAVHTGLLAYTIALWVV